MDIKLGFQAWKEACQADYLARSEDGQNDPARDPEVFEAIVKAHERLSNVILAVVGWEKHGHKLPAGCDKEKLCSIGRNLLTRALLDRPEHHTWSKYVVKREIDGHQVNVVESDNLDKAALRAMAAFFMHVSDVDLVSCLRAAGLNQKMPLKVCPRKRVDCWRSYKRGLDQKRKREQAHAERARLHDAMRAGSQPGLGG